MSPTTAVAANLPPRPPPSSIVEPVQRSPVLSPRIADPRQQRSGSVRPPSPPQRPSVAPQPKRPSTPPQPDRASTTPPRSPAEQKSENGSKKPEPIDMETFEQILELDEDQETYEFVWEMAETYFSQAEETFTKMSEAIDKGDCLKLSALGHFLKGSSATLGLVKLQSTCELVQHYGDLLDHRTGKRVTTEVALSKIAAALKEAKEQYKEAKSWLDDWHSEVEAKAKKEV